MSSTGVDTAVVQEAELASFTRQLGAMLDAGVNVLRALRIASQYSANDRLMSAAREIALRLEDGREFHQAIAPSPDLFNPFYVEMARQGEADGQLGKALLAVADYLDRAAGHGDLHERTAILPSSGVSAGVAALTMSTLGVLSLGAGAIWGIAAAEILPIVWLGPLAVLWSGVCLLCGAWLLRRLRQPEFLQPPTPLPPKTRERRVAETEAVVRNALEQQAEEEPVVKADPPSLKLEPKKVEPPGTNGKSTSAQKATDSDEKPPRLQL